MFVFTTCGTCLSSYRYGIFLRIAHPVVIKVSSGYTSSFSTSSSPEPFTKYAVTPSTQTFNFEWRFATALASEQWIRRLILRKMLQLVQVGVDG